MLELLFLDLALFDPEDKGLQDSKLNLTQKTNGLLANNHFFLLLAQENELHLAEEMPLHLIHELERLINTEEGRLLRIHKLSYFLRFQLRHLPLIVSREDLPRIFAGNEFGLKVLIDSAIGQLRIVNIELILFLAFIQVLFEPLRTALFLLFLGYYQRLRNLNQALLLLLLSLLHATPYLPHLALSMQSLKYAPR